MRAEHVQAEDMQWQCAKCDVPLVVGPVTATYMGAQFNAELAHCPRCGLVMISEATALGKMAEAEQILEDK